MPFFSSKNKTIWVILLGIILVFAFLYFNSTSNHKKAEQLTVNESENQSESDSLNNPIKGSTTFKQLSTSPSSVILTGLSNIKLLPMYKINSETDRNLNFSEGSSYYKNSDNNGEVDNFSYFMPGIDIFHGYNLINIGYFDLKKEKMSYFFQKPVLIKTFYFPSPEQDSLNNKPISRSYFMVSVYDEDTNKDSLINSKDLRKFYHFDEFKSTKTQILPNSYSSIRSTYDHKNDIMYIYARHDSNKNGTPEKAEPISIFYINLNEPTVVKQML